MKILVTGGAGYVGSHTCKELAKRGHEIVVYDNLSTGHRSFVKWGDFEHGDIEDAVHLRTVLKKHQPDGVIHFAAKAYVGESIIDPEKYFRTNVYGTLNLVSAMRYAGIRNIVVSGTCAVYGQPDTLPIDESVKENPINPYGATKLFMERILKDFNTAHNINWISLRYFNAAGNDADNDVGEWHEPETHLIPRVIQATLGMIPEVELFGNDYPTPDGTCIRDYVHVCDLATAHGQALELLASGDASQTINLGTEKGTSVAEIVNKIRVISEKDVPFIMQPRRAGDPAKLVACADKAYNVLGWKPTYSIDQTLESAFNWFNK